MGREVYEDTWLILGGLELAYGDTPNLTSKIDKKSKGQRNTAVKPFKFIIATHPPLGSRRWWATYLAPSFRETKAKRKEICRRYKGALEGGKPRGKNGDNLDSFLKRISNHSLKSQRFVTHGLKVPITLLK